MPEQYIVEHCSPTLAGIKTANLFSIRNDGGDINSEIRELNHMVTKKGLRAVPVQNKKGRTLVFLYRPDYLRRDLKHPVAIKILKEKGYSCSNAELCVAQLVQHLNRDGEFPHEIGLFLGYPPMDVRRFMQNPNDGVTFSGYWKSYGNKDEAERTNNKYRKCTEVYSRELKKGRPLSQLIVRTTK